MFTVIGEALLDLVQVEPKGPFAAKPGGGPLNIAVGLARLGHPTELKARLSTRPLGALLRDHALANSVGLSSCIETEDQTTLAFASLDDQHRASYEFYVSGTADWGWSSDELASLPSGTLAVHAGSLTATLIPGADVLLGLWERLAGEDELFLSYDPNVRPDVAGLREASVRRVERFVAASHLVKVSDEDLAWLYPHTPHLDVVRRWSMTGPELVVMTRGADGCVAVKATGESMELPGVNVEVVDTIGAGDSFAAGLLSGLADVGCLRPRAISAQPVESLHAALQRAIDVSAMTCERAGADPPTRARYDAMRSV